MQSLEPEGTRRWGLFARRGPGRSACLALATLVLATSCGRTPDDELRVGFGSGFSKLDPHFENTTASIEQLGNVFEPLVALDPEMRARPCLAESWSNPDTVTWVFRLRPSVTFHDGTPLTAGDVVYSLTRPRREKGLKTSSYLATVSEVRTSGTAVVIRTKWPNALLLGDLAFVPVVPKGSTTESLQSRPNGTGPWRVDGFVPGRKLRLRRNPAYWGPRPGFERASVDLSISLDEARAGVAAQRWQVVRYSATAVETLAKVGDRYALVRYPNIFLRHLAFDVASERTRYCPGIPNPFRKREVREAVSLALDRPAIAQRADPDAIPASQLVPPAIVGFDPGSPPVVQDVARARRLLEEAGLPDGFDVVLHRSGYGTAAEEVARQLKTIGIRVTVTPLSSTELFAALDRKELSFWIVADGCMTGDALELLFASFASPDPTTGAGVDNYGNYRNPQLDLTIADALRQFEPSVRLPALQSGLRIALADAAWVPLYFSRETLVVSRSLAYRPRADGLVRLADIRRAP
jgi:peptide/nickel transport system substrate-binding protein